MTYKIVDGDTVRSGSAWEYVKLGISGAELVLVFLAWRMAERIHRRHMQRKWVDCRFACELLRGLRAGVPMLDPLHPAMRVHDPAWSRFALSAGLFVHESSGAKSMEERKREYLDTRLSETHEAGQIRHYRGKSHGAAKLRRAADQVGAWSAILALVVVAISLANKVAHMFFPETHLPLGLGHWDRSFPFWLVVMFLPIALPLIAGCTGSLRLALDAGRRSRRYPEMEKRLMLIRRRLETLDTPGAIAEAVSQAEDLLLDELREWQLAASGTGAH